jgi:Zn finger protein HypA/HybF involved in hydrogenase expression
MPPRVRVSSAVKEAQKRFDVTKQIVKCNNCGFWKNFEKSDNFLLKNLGYLSCFNCGSTDINY